MVVGRSNLAGLSLYTVTALMPRDPLVLMYAGMYAIQPPTAGSIMTVRGGISAVSLASSPESCLDGVDGFWHCEDFLDVGAV